MQDLIQTTNLVQLDEHGLGHRDLITNSLIVAEVFERQHQHVLQAVENVIAQIERLNESEKFDHASTSGRMIDGQNCVGVSTYGVRGLRGISPSFSY